MSEKYGGLFVTDPKECRADMIYEGEAADAPLPANLSDPWALMRSADVAGATAYVTTSWVHEIDHDVEWVKEHDHDYDELLMFLGNDPENVGDLGGEVYLDIEGERHVLTTTSTVFIPAGTKHCPLGFNRVTRPFRFIAVCLNGTGTYQ